MNPSLSSAPARGAAERPVEMILGVPFFCGNAQEAVEATLRRRGLVVAPSGPNLAVMDRDPEYQMAVRGSDLALTDSGLMLALWALRHGRCLPRVSGLGYLRALLAHPGFAGESTLWVTPGPHEARRISRCLKQRGLSPGSAYLAPHYARSAVRDPELLAQLERERPSCVVICISGGVQEKLGLWLRERLSYRPAIVCIGAAIAFITGDQASIPPLADRLCVGWLLRCLRNPRRFAPRYLSALRLVPLQLRWDARPPLPRQR